MVICVKCKKETGKHVFVMNHPVCPACQLTLTTYLKPRIKQFLGLPEVILPTQGKTGV